MTKETTTQSLSIINKEIAEELKNPAIGRALLATTFKGLSEASMKQAIFEGITRGFTFKEFLQKDVYALPYGSGYSLVTSIDYARKITPDVWLSKDEYVMDGKEIVSCSVIAYKRIGQDIAEYPVTVFFSEYSTGRNLWISKPHTMISKVAEMHARRKAAPEKMAKVYTAEEFDKETEEVYDTEGITDDTIPTIHVGSSEHEDVAPNMTIDKKPRADDFEMPEDEAEQKNLIKGLAMKKWPDADARTIKTYIEDETQLAYKAENYKAIINYLR